MATEYWGIDVSPTSLKAVKLRGNREAPELTEVDAVDFGLTAPDSAGEGNIRPEIEDGLFEFAEQHPVGDGVITVSLPSHTTFNRFTTLPPVTEGRTEELVKHEAQQHIPFPLEDVIWDYQEIQKEGTGNVEVIIFAIKKEIVNEFLQSMKRAGMNPDIIQFSSVALYNFILYDQPTDQTTAVLDLGANNCDLMIIEGERHWTRDIPVSGDDFTEAIQREFDVSFEKAEQMKRSVGSSRDPEKFREILEPVYRNLIQEVHRSIGYYKSMSSDSTIDQIYLTGGGSRTFYLEKFISENMDFPVSTISRLNKVEFSDDLDEDQFNQIARSIGPATGLALQGMGATINHMNLMPDRVVREKELQRKKPFVISAVVLFAFAALLYVFSIFFRSHVYSERISALGDLEQSIESTQQEIESFRSSSDTSRFRTIGQQVNERMPNRQIPVLFWTELVRITPDNLALRNELNQLMLPYFKEAATDSSLPSSYAAFRRLDPDELDERWQNLQQKTRSLEKKFLFILGIDYSQEEDQTTFDVYCGIFQRGSRVDGLSFVREQVYQPLVDALNFQDTRSTGVNAAGEINQLRSPFSGETEGAGADFDLQKHFRMWKVRFSGPTSELRKQVDSET